MGRFDGGEITSDAGGVLLREVEQRTRILGRLSECFTDYRDPDRVEHPVEALIKQRVLGLCLGLRGPQRPRRVVPGPALGAVV